MLSQNYCYFKALFDCFCSIERIYDTECEGRIHKFHQIRGHPQMVSTFLGEKREWGGERGREVKL